MELIFIDVWELIFRNGQRVHVHAQSLSVQRAQDGAITGVTADPWPGIATSLEAVVPSEVVCVLRRREQGTLAALHRLAGKVEYLDESAKSVLMAEAKP